MDNFFPYSQKALQFNKPISIIFQSDEQNATKMLGKTAFYDPVALEIVLYVDGRHPKDILRSLSHELVHHAQNCRGDLGDKETGPGYAQTDPHMRKMEREAYTKGNLIFRDFEDLIKTGKINIEIDFSDSGEPNMSLNEWKNNELNTLLMKKWGLLKEDKGSECKEGFEWQDGECVELQQESEEEKLNEKTEGEETYDYGEEGTHFREGQEAEDLEETKRSWERIAQGGTATRPRHHSSVKGHTVAPSTGGLELGDKAYEPSTPEEIAAAKKFLAAKRRRGEIEEGWGWRDDDDDTGEAEAIKKADWELAGEEAGEDAAEDAPPPVGVRVSGRDLSRTTTKVRPVKVREAAQAKLGETQQLPRKISVREAKEITRRIVERIKKEAK